MAVDHRGSVTTANADDQVDLPPISILKGTTSLVNEAKAALGTSYNYVTSPNLYTCVSRRGIMPTYTWNTATNT